MDFDVWNSEKRRDCHALYRRMREVSPVHRALGPLSGHPYWFLTRYADATAMLRDPRFGMDVEKAVPDIRSRPYAFAFMILKGTMLYADPPAHTRLRGLVDRAFVPTMIEGLRPSIEAAAGALTVEVVRAGRFDFVKSFANRLPLSVIAQLLGVPDADHEKFHAWSQAMMMLRSREETKAAFAAFQGYFKDLVAARRADPRGDLISMMVQVEEGGDRLTEREIIASIGFLVSTGHETVASFLGNCVFTLLTRPDLLEQLRSDDALWPTAIEELLRCEGSIECALPRFAYTDVEIDGHTIARGDAVFACLLAANRDPAVFERPDEIDLRRKPNRHIAMGAGVHYCLGGRLGRLQAEIALRTLFAAAPGLRLDVDPATVEWISQSGEKLGVHGVRALPLAL